MAKVLCTGIDDSLLKTRELILQRAGHEVVTARGESAVAKACQETKFNVAVIGQTVSLKEKTRFLDLIRKHAPNARVLELYRSSTGRLLEGADAWLEVPADVPSELAERVTALAGRARKRQAKGQAKLGL